MEYNKIYNTDCLTALRTMQSNSIDLVVTDPPYKMQTTGAGLFRKTDAPKVMHNISDITCGFDFDNILSELVRVMKKINIYIFCSQSQIFEYLKYFVDDLNCNYDLLTWHKINPLPTCNNKYLSDTEYLLFFREKGVELYGNYYTKKKFFLSGINTDSKKIGHPTVKPLSIFRTLIYNSSKKNDIVLDPFIGSGTTAIAALQQLRRFIGFEINQKYFNIAQKRIATEQQQLTLNI